MTLHDAIEKLLRQTGRSMTTTEIAAALNKNQWYQKKDGSAITGFQIHGRTRNYSQVFNRDGSTVSLPGQAAKQTPSVVIQKQVAVPGLLPISNDQILLAKVLMNEQNYKLPIDADTSVPVEPGLYCLRLKTGSKLPPPFQGFLEERNHNILYIGIASQNLRTRMLNQELRAKGHGTFFRTIGAVLGYCPEKGSLLLKANKNNYTFKKEDEVAIIQWINQNLLVYWIVFKDEPDTLETTIIEKYHPLFNLTKNPKALKEISLLRANCVRVANSA